MMKKSKFKPFYFVKQPPLLPFLFYPFCLSNEDKQKYEVDGYYFRYLNSNSNYSNTFVGTLIN